MSRGRLLLPSPRLGCTVGPVRQPSPRGCCPPAGTIWRLCWPGFRAAPTSIKARASSAKPPGLPRANDDSTVVDGAGGLVSQRRLLEATRPKK